MATQTTFAEKRRAWKVIELGRLADQLQKTAEAVAGLTDGEIKSVLANKSDLARVREFARLVLSTLAR